MKKLLVFNVALTLLLGVGTAFSLSSSNRMNIQKPSMAMNAQPLIINEVASISASLNVKNTVMLDKICEVSYGHKNLREIKDELSQASMLREMPGKKSIFYDIANSEDLQIFSAVCVAYLIDSVKNMPNMNQALSNADELHKKKVINVSEVDKTITELMPFKMAISRATTELYAFIAHELEIQDAQKIESYRNQIDSLFVKYSAEYLNSLSKYTREELNNQFSLISLKDDEFGFRNRSGYEVYFRPNGFELYLYGTPWLAKGYFLGLNQKILVN